MFAIRRIILYICEKFKSWNVCSNGLVITSINSHKKDSPESEESQAKTIYIFKL